MTAFAALLASCGADDSELSCRDLLPPNEVSYAKLAELVTNVDDPKSCSLCHNSESPLRGLNLETPDASYPALVRRAPLIYAQVATGEMPEDGRLWSETDLALFRSWYCYGALP